MYPPVTINASACCNLANSCPAYDTRTISVALVAVVVVFCRFAGFAADDNADVKRDLFCGAPFVMWNVRGMESVKCSWGRRWVEWICRRRGGSV